MPDVNNVNQKNNPVEHRYEQLRGKREGFLSRARDFSRFTLPHLLPHSDETGSDAGDGSNQYGWYSGGAENVNHLSNKMANTLFPVAHDFFTLSFDTQSSNDLAATGVEEKDLYPALTNAKNMAKEREREVHGRLANYQVMEHLIVTGNVLEAFLDGKMQVIPLDRYVVRRDRAGNLRELIIKEEKSIQDFPTKVQGKLKAQRQANRNDDGKNDDVKLFTKALLKKGLWQIEQEVEGLKVAATQKTENLDMWPLRWKHNYGEDYGRGLVENHAGDFFVVSFLSQAIVKGMALMSDVKYLIKPGSMINIDDFLDGETGDVLFGHADDVTVIQLDKFADFKPISEVLAEYERRLGRAFLMNSQMRRNAERVTTVELRMDAMELEGALGGVYTTLEIDLQRPLAGFYLRGVSLKDTQGIEPVIKTGMDALGRSGDLDNLYQFSELMSIPSQWSPEAQYAMKWPTFMAKVGKILGMELDFVMTEDELAAKRQAEQQQQQESMAAEAVANGASKAIPDMINK